MPSSRQPGDGEGTKSSAEPAEDCSRGGCRERAAQPGDTPVTLRTARLLPDLG